MPTGTFNLRRFLRNAAIIGIAVGAPVGIWFGGLDDCFIPKRFGQVTESIHRSGQMSECIVGRTLRSHHITRIIDLTEPEYMPDGKVREQEVARELGIEIVNYPLVGDGTGDVERYARAVAELIEADRKSESVLVHCAAGTQRTGGVVACFRILYQNWTLEEALNEARQYDWKPEEVAMSNYVETNLPRIRELLVQWGTLQASAG